ncbi:uncharacterized protein SCHCODRAFT_02598251 [Schizophyllum commune H4-8]|uniref:RBR-type E3 ubiquitin transferase n=1 Tax=Schizophyllum commune (strain H4-8 / FGSC 9210) TaxID=578458 RepID=D8Q0G1_SCHCM|nr:uncharacterized protein SCHCODRAFT_02598251 [Schizophyllum commune H4-8]KAI5895003.1 hypothetical protein SCHCODRAFT_02598251 [Schizophyllum commune H4-8]
MADMGYCTNSGCICRQFQTLDVSADVDEPPLHEADAMDPTSEPPTEFAEEAESAAFDTDPSTSAAGMSWADDVEDNFYSANAPDAANEYEAGAESEAVVENNGGWDDNAGGDDGDRDGTAGATNDNDGWGDSDMGPDPWSMPEPTTQTSAKKASQSSVDKEWGQPPPARKRDRPRSISSKPSSRPSPRDSSGSSPAPGQDVCRFWLKGTCMHGKNCRYKHSNESRNVFDKSPAPRGNSTSRASPRGSSTSSPAPWGSSASAPGRDVCRFWLKGDCKYGNSCRYEHSNESRETAQRGYNSSKGRGSDPSRGRGTPRGYDSPRGRGSTRGGYDSPRGRSANGRGGKSRASSTWGGGGWASSGLGDWGSPTDDAQSKDDGNGWFAPADVWNIPQTDSNATVETDNNPWDNPVGAYDPWGEPTSTPAVPAAGEREANHEEVADCSVGEESRAQLPESDSDRRQYVGNLDLPPHLQSAGSESPAGTLGEKQSTIQAPGPQQASASSYLTGNIDEFMEPPGLPSRLASRVGSASPNVKGWSTPARGTSVDGSASRQEPSAAAVDIGTWKFNRDEFMRDTPVTTDNDKTSMATNGRSKAADKVPITLDAPSSAIDSEGPDTGKFDDIFGCSVRIGSGGVVHSVRTPFDPDTVEISGYPKDTPLDQLCEFQMMFPGIRQVRFEPTYCIQYSEASQAAHVREELDGKEWNGHILSACFDMTGMIEPAEHDGRKVEISYPYPKLSAWIYMSSMTQARKMQEDFEKEPRYVRGWKVTVTVQKRARSVESVALKLDNLPTSATDEDISLLCIGYPVTTRAMNKPTYKRDALEQVKQLVDADGEQRFLSFVKLPDGDPPTTCRALVEFKEAADAQAAIANLNGTQQSFLGKEDKLRLRLVSAYRREISRKHLDVLQEDLAQLPRTPGLRILFGNTNFGARIVVTGSDARAVVIARQKVDKLLRGHVVRRKDTISWHEFFVTAPGEKKLQELDPSLVVVADRRLRQLRIVGGAPGTPAFDKAQNMINAMIKALSAGRDQLVLPLSYDQLGYIVNYGLRRLRDRFGDEDGVKLVFRPADRTLVVRGKADFRDSVREAVETLPKRPRPAQPYRQCPVCTGQPEDGRPLPCGHEYCLTCLQHVLRAGVSEPFAPLSCVAAGCGTLVPSSMIKDKLSTKEAKALVGASLLSYVHDQPGELRFCPTGCDVLYRPLTDGLIIRCPSCRERLCASCGVVCHEGMTCAEYRYEGGSWETLN